MGLRVGPWLRDFKRAVIRGEGDETPIKVSPSQKGPMPLGWLKNHLVKISPGQRLGYVVDAGYGQTNHQRIVALVQGADLLFIEAAFLHEDAERAKATSHLTAFQAGCLAAEAGVKRVIPFHFSPKYGSGGERIASEVQEAFNGFAAQGP
jgi:ribonuclease Z